MDKLWGGRFEKDADNAFMRFNQSLNFDYRLFAEELVCSRAFITGLHRLGILTDDEHTQLDHALQQIKKELNDNPQTLQNAITKGVEDIHSFVEQALFAKVGELAYKANTGRSRNEQVSTVTRLWLIKQLDEIVLLIQTLQHSLWHKAEAHLEDIVMGYTHLQQAQPITWGHYFLSFYDMLTRDLERLIDAKKRCDYCPLGLGAIAGSAWNIDRNFLAHTLGFTHIATNSLDAVSDRDFVIESVSAITMLGIHLSKLAEDFIIYSTAEFGLLELSDEVASGSSLMPQKKNPDSLELIRGKSGRLLGQLTGLFSIAKSLPSGYNKDLQEDKEALFDVIDTIKDMLLVADVVVRTVTVKTVDYDDSFAVATELADYLSRKSMPFRKAHHIVGQIVNFALKKSCSLSELTLEEFRRFSPLIDGDIYKVLTIEAAIATKSVVGGTAIAAIRQRLDELCTNE
ncbi:MAG: argininosuccinate lyase [Francisellaceae bacterium]